MLEFDQRQVQSVGSGAEALALCEKESFDLVVVDYLMPAMRGDILARTLKERHPHLPILMITADVEKMDPSAQLPTGVDLVMGKPFRFNALREAVNKVLAKT